MFRANVELSLLFGENKKMLYKYAVNRINMQYFSYICIGIGWSSYQLIRLTQWAFPFF